MMERYANTVNCCQPFTIYVKLSMLDVWHGSEYASILDISNQEKPVRA